MTGQRNCRKHIVSVPTDLSVCYTNRALIRWKKDSQGEHLASLQMMERTNLRGSVSFSHEKRWHISEETVVPHFQNEAIWWGVRQEQMSSIHNEPTLTQCRNTIFYKFYCKGLRTLCFHILVIHSRSRHGKGFKRSCTGTFRLPLKGRAHKHFKFYRLCVHIKFWSRITISSQLEKFSIKKEVSVY